MMLPPPGMVLFDDACSVGDTEMRNANKFPSKPETTCIAFKRTNHTLLS